MRVVVVPGPLALLPEYASREDPVPDLRRAVEAAVAWLVEDGPAALEVATDSALRVGAHLLGDRLDPGGRERLLVLANGSAKRTEKAPGHFDERAERFDAELGHALRTADGAALATIDASLAEELWADVGALRSLRHVGAGIDPIPAQVEVDYDAAPYGVQYWVVRWLCAL